MDQESIVFEQKVLLWGAILINDADSPGLRPAQPEPVDWLLCTTVEGKVAGFSRRQNKSILLMPVSRPTLCCLRKWRIALALMCKTAKVEATTERCIVEERGALWQEESVATYHRHKFILALNLRGSNALLNLGKKHALTILRNAGLDATRCGKFRDNDQLGSIAVLKTAHNFKHLVYTRTVEIQ